MQSIREFAKRLKLHELPQSKKDALVISAVVVAQNIEDFPKLDLHLAHLLVEFVRKDLGIEVTSK
jgi:hypothetical protein